MTHGLDPRASTATGRALAHGGLLVLALAFGPGRRDLDVALPPGSPLEWAASLPAYTPPRVPLFPTSPGSAPARSAAKPGTEAGRSSARPAQSEADARFASAFGQVRILTWDLSAHLPWMALAPAGPVTGRGSGRARPTEFGDPLYWLALAPLLRLLLHPDALSRSETLAHLVELGEPVLPVATAAAAEGELAPACRELMALIPTDVAALPGAPAGATPRASALARFVLEECLRDRPYDPSDDFGRRLFLFAAEAEPLLCAYAEHPSRTLARNAVAALARYETRGALQFLAALAARTEDPVTRVRALSALGRFRGALEVTPLIERLGRTKEPVQRAALVGALGRMGVRAAAPRLLELGQEARKAKDSDLLISVLSALARIAWIQPQPELAAFCERVQAEARELGQRSLNAMKADVPDPPSLRAEILTQLALLARAQAAPGDARLAAEILELATPGPLDARLSELGVGGTDPLASVPAAVRFLYLEALARVGPAGLERLAALARCEELETALRGRALALLAYEPRAALATAWLAQPKTPVELRIQALEVLIADLHPRAEELCRAQLVAPALAEPQPAAGELHLALRAVRFLSETGKLAARELLPLFPLVQRPSVEREAALESLRASAAELVEAARTGTREKELETRAGALFDQALELRFDALLEPAQRDARVHALLAALEPARAHGVGPEIATRLAPRLVALLVGVELDGWLPGQDPGRKLFRPSVPLAEEALLALGRTRDPLALELVLAVLEHGARELRGHAALALGMGSQPALAEKLLPALLDADPFVRFAASESLRHLTAREPTLDWISAPSSARQAAAETLRGELLEQRARTKD